jgi:beta-glucosidase
MDLLTDDQLQSAIEAAKQADIIVLWLGETPDLSGEAGSRLEPVIPDGQRHLYEALKALGKPIILLLCTGRPLISPDILRSAPTVLVTWFLGIEAGSALAALLSGKEDITGRLPVSWPEKIGQIPVYFGDRATGRPANPADRFTSRYLDGPVTPLYPFGFGLSYADITMDSVEVTDARVSQDIIQVKANLSNQSDRSGTQTLFVFIRKIASVPTRPKLECRGFGKVTLGPHQAGQITFTLHLHDFSRTGHQAAHAEAGDYEILVGPHADRGSMQAHQIKI